MVIYVTDDSSMKEFLKVLDNFSLASGSKINKSKTQYTFLGAWSWRKDIIGGLSLCTGPMEILGVTFGHTEGDRRCNPRWMDDQDGGA